jgi:hypothetical protein
MAQLPRSPGSTLVSRLYQETVHDFILLFMPPWGPHLTPLATGSLERSLLLFSAPGGLTGNDLLRLFFTCTNTSQAATCICNTLPRISPHNVVNHSSHKEATIHQSSNHTWSSLLPRLPGRASSHRQEDLHGMQCKIQVMWQLLYLIQLLLVIFTLTNN